MVIHWNLGVACDNQLLGALTILNELISSQAHKLNINELGLTMTLQVSIMIHY